MKQMSKWHIHNTATSRAELKKERKTWYCLLEITTTWDASLIKWSWLVPWFEIWMKLSRRSSCWESMRRSLSQKITELDALCKKLREDTQRLEKEKTTLKWMVESRDELLMEIATETGLDRMGEDDEDEEEEKDADDGEDAAAPPAAAPPPPVPPAATSEEINDEGLMEMIPDRETPVLHEVILADAEPKMSQLRLYHALMRDYEKHPLRMEDDFDDLDDDPNEGRSDMDQWFSEDRSNDRDWVIKSKSSVYV
jgi:hypothetical protein